MAGDEADAFVLDASVAVAWCFRDEASPAAAALLESMERRTAWVPILWHFEVANLLMQAERRGRATEAGCADFIDTLNALPIETEVAMHGRVFGHVRMLARRHGLTVYDAAYLDVAIQRRIPLATRDRALARAARAAGVAVIELAEPTG